MADNIIKKYDYEKDMCADITANAKEKGWKVFPEQGGWDIVLVSGLLQVGIQAKLRPNLKLFMQTVVDDGQPEPHFKAIAIGNLSRSEKKDIERLATYMKFIFIDMSYHHFFWLVHNKKDSNNVTDWAYYFTPSEKALWLPPVIADIDAGVPSPKTVSPWMVAAIKLEEICKAQGWVLLTTYYICSMEKDPRSKRGKKWKPRKISKASEQFPHVSAAFKDLK
jgi:hypothetical protein